MNAKKNGLDKELIIILGVISLVVSLGIIFFGLFFLGVDVYTCDKGGLIGIYSLITGGLWGVLLCRNCWLENTGYL